MVTVGVRPLRDGKEPLLESTAGHTMELVLEQPEVESTDVLAPTPLHSVPGATVEPPRLDETSVGSSEDADVAGAESGSTSTEEETPDAPPTLAAKEVTETPPPNVEATSDSSALDRPTFVSTETSNPLLKDAEAEDVDVHLYRPMIRSLMYLTTSRPDI
ncbi:hypothetical protein Tco_0995369, partial [Tanacetum coccineum]